MAKCNKCGLEIEGEPENCADCGVPLHKKCSKQYSGKRYCKKCGKKVRELMRLQAGY